MELIENNELKVPHLNGRNGIYLQFISCEPMILINHIADEMRELGWLVTIDRALDHREWTWAGPKRPKVLHHPQSGKISVQSMPKRSSIRRSQSFSPLVPEREMV